MKKEYVTGGRRSLWWRRKKLCCSLSLKTYCLDYTCLMLTFYPEASPQVNTYGLKSNQLSAKAESFLMAKTSGSFSFATWGLSANLLYRYIRPTSGRVTTAIMRLTSVTTLISVEIPDGA